MALIYKYTNQQKGGMMKSEFGAAIMAALASEQQTQTWLASSSGLTQGALNQLINKGLRPKRETLTPICNAFARPDGLDVLCGHLRDEIAAAGFRRSEIILSTHAAKSDDKIDRAIDDLRAIASQRRDVAQLLLDLAALCHELPSQNEIQEIRSERKMAAEKSPGIKPRKSKKDRTKQTRNLGNV